MQVQLPTGAGGVGVDDRALRGNHGHRVDEAFVDGDVLVAAARDGDEHEGHGVRDRAVDESGDLRCRAGEVERQIRAGDRRGAADGDVVPAHVVVIHVGLGAEGAGPPARDLRAYSPLGVGDVVVERSAHGIDAVAIQQLPRAALGQPAGPDHGVEIALDPVGQAVVGDEHVEHVAALLAALVELDRRDDHAVLPDVARPRVVAARDRAADVAHVGAHRREQDGLAIMEHGRQDHVIGDVGAAVVGVARHDDVAGVEVVPERLQRALDRGDDGVEVQCAARCLGDQAGLEPDDVEDRRREVVRLVEDRRPGGAGHGRTHLLGDRLQRPADDPGEDHLASARHFEPRRSSQSSPVSERGFLQGSSRVGIGWEPRAGGAGIEGRLALVRGRDALDPGNLAPRQGPTWRDTNAEWRLLNVPRASRVEVRGCDGYEVPGRFAPGGCAAHALTVRGAASLDIAASGTGRVIEANHGVFREGDTDATGRGPAVDLDAAGRSAQPAGSQEVALQIPRAG